MTITLETVGKRVYFVGNTYAAKDAIKKIGGHWDGDRKQWWIGSAKMPDAEALVSAPVPTAAEDTDKDTDKSRVYAKVTHKGRTYYVIAEGADRCRLAVLDKSFSPFWADKAACQLVKAYQPRERTWRGRTETSYTTLGGIRDFVASQKDAEASGLEACCACGKRSANLHHDLEDGGMKCYACCDIPA